MPSFQPYHDVPGIEEYDCCLSTGPQWANIAPSLELIDSQEDYNPSHAWYAHQRLYDPHLSIDGYNHVNSLQLPEEKFSRLRLQSQWTSDSPDLYRHMRYLSPGGVYGATSATDSTTSEEALSPEATRQYPAMSRLPSMNHLTYCSPSPEMPFTAGNGSWMPPTLYSNASPSSSYTPGDRPACNLKDIQYSHDEEMEEERPSVAEHQPPFLQNQPEELAFADEGLGRSIGDDDSMKESESEDEEPQYSDDDTEYSPTQNRKHSSFTSRAGRSSPRRTRSLQSTTSPTISSHNKVVKPAHANHRRHSSNPKTRIRSSTTTTTTKSGNKKPSKQFPCTFSHYGCPSIFASKNEWKRHVASQHLQLGFYRCTEGYCNPENNVGSGKGGHGGSNRGYNDFNRKDLFTQHCRRMHVPFPGKYENATSKMREEFDRSMEEVRERCWVVRRERPNMAMCGVGDCGRVFRGENAWEERMEHVGKHFERGEGAAQGQGQGVKEDTYLTEWAVKEGVVRDLGGRGVWLVGIEPDDHRDVGAAPAAVVGGGRGVGRGGRRGAAGAAAGAAGRRSGIKDEDEDDGDED